MAEMSRGVGGGAACISDFELLNETLDDAALRLRTLMLAETKRKAAARQNTVTGKISITVNFKDDRFYVKGNTHEPTAGSPVTPPEVAGA